MIKVSFQGERGAYSEAAAISFFDEDVETVPLPTFADVIDYTTSGKTDYSVVPVENSIEGSVGESYDLLYSTSLNAIGEIYHKIEHCLIGKGSLDQIDTVYSHPQALGQCRKFIQQKNMKTVPSYDTAGSVKIIKEMNKENVACIASKNASEINQVPIIKEGIADNPNNFTRFLVLSKKLGKKTQKDKTSIIFSIKHEQGALFRIMEKFNEYGVNLTKIESRPKKDTTWEYNFYVDFEGNVDDVKISEMVNKIKENTLFLKILGSYPAAELA
ncbi:MAG: prephenate dehydratase [Nitrosopumilaceae archaeon]